MLKIIRGDSLVDKDELYEVVIDNFELLEIGNDEIKNLKIKSGQHSIMIRSKSFKSKTIKFYINSGEIVEFECGPQVKDSAISRIIYKFLLGGKGLYLRKKSDFYL